MKSSSALDRPCRKFESQRRGSRLVLAGVVVLGSIGQGRADDAPLTPGITLLVAVEPAELMVESKVVGRVPRGEVIQAALVDGDWLFLSDRQGWIHRDDVWTADAAEAHYTKEIDKEPTAAAFHSRGVARNAGGRFAEAIADFTAALEREPKSSSSLNNRGIARHKRKELDRAIEDFTAALDIEPTATVVWLNRSAVWVERGDATRALDDAKKAAELSPESPAALNSRGVGLLLSNELEKAAADFDDAIRRSPRFAAAYANRATVRSRQGRMEAALKDYETAIGLDERSAAHRNDLAWLLVTGPNESLRDAKRAVRLATEACEMTKSSDWNYLDTLATALRATGDHAQASAAWRAALSLAPEKERAALQEKLDASIRAESKAD